jgi:hypothetical protein
MQKKALLVYAPDAEVAGALDRHCGCTRPPDSSRTCAAIRRWPAETPVVIAGELESLPQNERLFNLSAKSRPAFRAFTSVIEVVGQRRRTSARPVASASSSTRIAATKSSISICGETLMAEDDIVVPRRLADAPPAQLRGKPTTGVEEASPLLASRFDGR